MHVYDDKTRRGGLWIWCSECYTFSHGSIYVPEYWGNCPLVESEKLCGMPVYLDEIREIIDTHVDTIMNNYITRKCYRGSNPRNKNIKDYGY